MTHRAHTPSRPLRTRLQRNPQSDNLVLMSATMLPFKGQWGPLASAVASRAALFIVPEGETPLRRAMRQLVPQLRASGRHVTALSAKRFG